MIDRSEILRFANQCIAADRATTYGDAEQNFEEIAAAWSWWLAYDVRAEDVGPMMALLKIARSKAAPDHVDNYVDACGYLALAGEIAQEGRTCPE
jgi:hypothetical protein